MKNVTKNGGKMTHPKTQGNEKAAMISGAFKMKKLRK